MLVIMFREVESMTVPSSGAFKYLPRTLCNKLQILVLADQRKVRAKALMSSINSVGCSNAAK